MATQGNPNATLVDLSQLTREQLIDLAKRQAKQVHDLKQLSSAAASGAAAMTPGSNAASDAQRTIAALKVEVVNKVQQLDQQAKMLDDWKAKVRAVAEKDARRIIELEELVGKLKPPSGPGAAATPAHPPLAALYEEAKAHASGPAASSNAHAQLADQATRQDEWKAKVLAVSQRDAERIRELEGQLGAARDAGESAAAATARAEALERAAAEAAARVAEVEARLAVATATAADAEARLASATTSTAADAEQLRRELQNAHAQLADQATRQDEWKAKVLAVSQRDAERIRELEGQLGATRDAGESAAPVALRMDVDRLARLCSRLEVAASVCSPGSFRPAPPNHPPSLWRSPPGDAAAGSPPRDVAAGPPPGDVAAPGDAAARPPPGDAAAGPPTTSDDVYNVFFA